MSDAAPNPGSYWIYCGPDPGRNEIHRVIGVLGGEGDGPEVVTWGKTRMSWLGPAEEFHRHFKPLAQEAHH